MLEKIGDDLKTLVMLIIVGSVDDVDLSRKDRVPRFWADD